MPLCLLGIAALYDLRDREIPDTIPLLLVGGAIVTSLSGGLPIVWWQSLVGGILGGLVVLPFYLAGGFGGGDLKLCAAIGCWLGPVWLWPALFWMAMAGAVLAVAAALRGEKAIAYGPAIASGFLIQFFCPNLLRTFAFGAGTASW